MHVEIARSSRIELWDLLDLAQGKQQEELMHCIPSKALRNHERRASTAPSGQGHPGSASLTISNIRNGKSLANSKYPFLWKLHEMLEDCEKTGDDHIVSWMDEGRSFRVHKPKSFMEKIVPHYFKQTKFKSFQRQLHLYDFIRTPRGVFAGAYAHPQFIRGKKSLCLSLSPHKIKGKTLRTSDVVASDLSQSQIPETTPLSRKRARDRTVEDCVSPGTSPKRTCVGTTDKENASAMKPLELHTIQRNLVTGAALAAELKAKTKQIAGTTGHAPAAESQAAPSSKGTNTFCSSCPHAGDVVYAFDDKPFRFIDDVCHDDKILEDILMDTLERDDMMGILSDILSGEEMEM